MASHPTAPGTGQPGVDTPLAYRTEQASFPGPVNGFMVTMSEGPVSLTAFGRPLQFPVPFPCRLLAAGWYAEAVDATTATLDVSMRQCVNAGTQRNTLASGIDLLTRPSGVLSGTDLTHTNPATANAPVATPWIPILTPFSLITHIAVGISALTGGASTITNFSAYVVLLPVGHCEHANNNTDYNAGGGW